MGLSFPDAGPSSKNLRRLTRRRWEVEASNGTTAWSLARPAPSDALGPDRGGD